MKHQGEFDVHWTDVDLETIYMKFEVLVFDSECGIL